ncbi:MAG: pyridoxine 5'-phosphate synthase, partial [Steroidobacteraceae bacterium]
MMRLHINIDHVATVRQARRTDEPDPVRAAVLAELGGADGVTVHLREDRRHIQDRDVRLLMQTVRTGVNLELAAVAEMIAIAAELKPMTVTLVPERREEITTEGGLCVADAGTVKKLSGAVETLRREGIRCSLFIDPEPATLEAAARIGADAVELHTGAFAASWKAGHSPAARQAVAAEVARLRRAAALGVSLGLAVHAGHGLTYENVRHVAGVPGIEELNIGHSVISRA